MLPLHHRYVASPTISLPVADWKTRACIAFLPHESFRLVAETLVVVNPFPANIQADKYLPSVDDQMQSSGSRVINHRAESSPTGRFVQEVIAGRVLLTQQGNAEHKVFPNVSAEACHGGITDTHRAGCFRTSTITGGEYRGSEVRASGELLGRLFAYEHHVFDLEAVLVLLEPNADGAPPA